MIKNAAKRIYLVLICLILYAPIVTLMVLSFNNTKTRSRWGGFTGKWYVSLFQNKEIMNALYTTLIIALLSALIATLIILWKMHPPSVKKILCIKYWRLERYAEREL